MRVILLTAFLTVTSAHAFEWRTVRLEGRDYMSARQIAEFYHLPIDQQPDGNTLSLKRGDRSLQLTLNSREAVINGVKFVFCFAVTAKDGDFLVARMDLSNVIEPAFRPELVENIKPFSTVILDPGHGGHDKGAASPHQFEKNFALDVARRVRNELQKSGVRVLMTRNSDVFVELDDRAAIANARMDAIFVSLHFNAGAGNAAAEGLEIFCITPRGAPSTEYDELLVRDMVQEFGNLNELPSFTLAATIHHSLFGSQLGMFDRGVKRARFAVLRRTKMPSVLVEGGFLSNPGDARRVASTDWRNTYATAIARGIMEYRRLAEFHSPPRTAADYRDNAAPRAAATPDSPTLTLRELPADGAN